MATLTLTGWRPGAQTLSAVQALSRIGSVGLGEAKDTIEAVLEGHQPTVKLNSVAAAEGLAVTLRALGFAVDLRTGDLHPCPCCGFLVFEDSVGSYEICPICTWEDDGVQLANPTSAGGANSDSLHSVQLRALVRAPVATSLLAGYRRDTRWRPLTPAEVTRFERLKAGSHWHTPAVTDLAEAYWHRPAE